VADFNRTEVLDVLVLSPVFNTGVGCEEHPGQVRFLCTSAVTTVASRRS